MSNYIESVLKAREMKGKEMEIDDAENEDGEKKGLKRKLEKDLVEELLEDYSLDVNKTKDLANDEWKYDPIPQIIDGHNVADFIDIDIVKVSLEFVLYF